jgi:choline kinase
MIIEYQLKAFENYDEIRIVTGYKAEQVMAEASLLRKDVRFIKNDNYANTTTLQSMHLGSIDINGKTLFVDGDMILSKQTAVDLYMEYEKNTDFIGVASEITDTPVYAGIENNKVTWFSFEKQANHEWANVAYLDSEKIQYNQTHLFTQLEKFLPMKAFAIERLEIDTPNDLLSAEKYITENFKKFDFWSAT